MMSGYGGPGYNPRMQGSYPQGNYPGPMANPNFQPGGPNYPPNRYPQYPNGNPNFAPQQQEGLAVRPV